MEETGGGYRIRQTLSRTSGTHCRRCSERRRAAVRQCLGGHDSKSV